MAQHFLLKAEARSLTLKKVFRLNEEEAREVFARMRWADTDGKPVCPTCGFDEHYWLSTRKIWKCKVCKKQFSVTSGTIFHSRKLELVDYLAAVVLFVNNVKGISALGLSRELDVQYKTAYVLSQKIREAITKLRELDKLEGIVEVDGGYVGGSVRKANQAINRVDRRTYPYKNPDRRCILVARERGAEGEGAVRTRTSIIKEENTHQIKVLRDMVSANAHVFTDEASCYKHLTKHFQAVSHVNHSICYSDGDACTNQAESFFARIRRAHGGQFHHWSLNYLAAYVEEIAYREDTRRMSNGQIWADILGKCGNAPKSRQWVNYGRRVA